MSFFGRPVVRVESCDLCDVSTFDVPLDGPVGARLAARRMGWMAQIVDGKVIRVCPRCIQKLNDDFQNDLAARNARRPSRVRLAPVATR